MVTTCMEIEIIQPFEDWILTVKKLRNDIIGSDKRKEGALVHIPKLLEFLQEASCPLELKVESAVVLGSLAKGTASQIQHLFESGALQVLLKCTDSVDLKLVEMCLSCIKSLVCRVEPAKYLIFTESGSISRLASSLSRSQSCKEHVSTIFYRSCKTYEQQLCLYKNGAIQSIVELVTSSSNRVRIAAMRCLMTVVFQNVEVSNAVVNCSAGDSTVSELLLRLQQRDKPIEVQLCAAKCLAYLLKNEVVKFKKEFAAQKVLATLIFMCQPDKMWVHRCEGAYCLAYFTENDVKLQYLASISGQIVSALSDYFNYDDNNFDAVVADPYNSSSLLSDLEEHNIAIELKKAAFDAYASLSANLEDVRKRILESASIKQYVIDGLSDADVSVRCSALSCLLSLSRSVHLLRTNFDKKIGGLVFDIFLLASDEKLLAASTAMLCNILLDFSPVKEMILNEKETVNTEFGNVERHSVAILKLLKLTRSDNIQIKLNAIWCIMNMTFMWPDEEKDSFLSSLKNDDIFHLIRSNDVDVAMKALGTLRNLISTETHSVDRAMEKIGRKVMESVVLVLEGDFPVEVKEQALCILVNISSGKTSKDFIMDNQDVLRKIANYLVHDCKRLQLSANDCIFNLVKHEHEGYQERQAVFQQLHVEKVLQNLQKTMNAPDLRERAKQTLDMF